MNQHWRVLVVPGRDFRGLQHQKKDVSNENNSSLVATTSVNDPRIEEEKMGDETKNIMISRESWRLKYFAFKKNFLIFLTGSANLHPFSQKNWVRIEFSIQIRLPKK
jgi:hypothetical protein